MVKIRNIQTAKYIPYYNRATQTCKPGSWDPKCYEISAHMTKTSVQRRRQDSIFLKKNGLYTDNLSLDVKQKMGRVYKGKGEGMGSEG